MKTTIVSRWRETPFRASDVSRTNEARGPRDLLGSLLNFLSCLGEILRRFTPQDTSLARNGVSRQRLVRKYIKFFGGLIVVVMLSCRHSSSSPPQKTSEAIAAPISPNKINVEITMDSIDDVLSQSVSPIGFSLVDSASFPTLDLVKKTGARDRKHDRGPLLGGVDLDPHEVKEVLSKLSRLPKSADGILKFYNRAKKNGIPVSQTKLSDDSLLYQIRMDNVPPGSPYAWFVAVVGEKSIERRLMVNERASEFDQRLEDIKKAEVLLEEWSARVKMIEGSKPSLSQVPLPEEIIGLGLYNELVDAMAGYMSEPHDTRREIERLKEWPDRLKRPFSAIKIGNHTFLARVLEDGSDVKLQTLANDLIESLRSDDETIEAIWSGYGMNRASSASLHFLFRDFRSFEGLSYLDVLEGSGIEPEKMRELRGRLARAMVR